MSSLRKEYLSVNGADFTVVPSPPYAAHRYVQSGGTFAEELTDLIASIRLRNSPAFVMIDPFGVSGVAMDHIKDLMSCPSTEVYVSLMYRDINRFATNRALRTIVGRSATSIAVTLFGCTDWRNSRSINGTMERRNFFYDLYERQLRLSGAYCRLSYMGNRD